MSAPPAFISPLRHSLCAFVIAASLVGSSSVVAHAQTSGFSELPCEQQPHPLTFRARQQQEYHEWLLRNTPDIYTPLPDPRARERVSAWEIKHRRYRQQLRDAKQAYEQRFYLICGREEQNKLRKTRNLKRDNAFAPRSARYDAPRSQLRTGGQVRRVRFSPRLLRQERRAQEERR